MTSKLDIKRKLKRLVGTRRYVRRVMRLTDEERRFLTAPYDARTPLPVDAEQELHRDNPRLLDLRARYSQFAASAGLHSRWSTKSTDYINDYLLYFRGDSPYVWHYRELPKVTRLKYFVFLTYVQKHDALGLLSQLMEDGAFGCWHFDYPGSPIVSRDLLDSINEINFLDRHVGLGKRSNLRILDIGAGYGRLAHRMLMAAPNVSRYVCVDAVPESTFLCEYYLRYRNLMPRARVVALDEVQTQLSQGNFDLAVNIHSFSECTLVAVSWWIDQLARLEVPQLLIIPNHPEKLLTLERNGDHQDFMPLLQAAGYELSLREPVFDDPGVRDTLGIHDHFFLFTRNAGS